MTEVGREVGRMGKGRRKQGEGGRKERKKEGENAILCIASS